MNESIATTDQCVKDVAHVVGWTSGDVLRLDDPYSTSDSVSEVVDLDISGYLANLLGSVSPSKGVMRGIFDTSSDGVTSIILSAGGSVFGGNSRSHGSRNTTAIAPPAWVPLPTSDSNLHVLRAALDNARNRSDGHDRACAVRVCPGEVLPSFQRSNETNHIASVSGDFARILMFFAPSFPSVSVSGSCREMMALCNSGRGSWT